jgi:uncharacterized protein (TIGR00369 family)
MFTDSQQELLTRVRQIPIVSTLSMRFEEMGEGWCRVSVPHDRKYDGIFESFHGGLLMTVADSVACFAIMTRLGWQEVLTTTDMNIRFLNPCLTDVTAHARVIKIGKTLCPVAVDLFDADRKHIAVAQVTYIRLPAMPAR